MLTEIQRQERNNYIGGSDAAAILGVSKYKNIIDLYLEKIGYKKPDDISNLPHIRAGNYLEAPLRQWFSDDTGLEVIEEHNTIYHPEYPWMAANIDGRIVGRNEILEIKTSRFGHEFSKVYEKEDIPEEYMAQIAHYCIVTGAERCYLAALIGGSDFRVYVYERNEKLEKAIIEKEKNFWLENVKKEIPPEPVTVEQVMALYGATTNSNATVSNTDIEDYVKSFLYRKAIKEDAEKCLDELKNKICSFMGQSDLLLDEFGNKLATWKSRKGSALFDRKKFKQDYPDLEKQYTVEGEPTRVFSVVSKGE